ncbi:MAG: Flp family type IVb pilin [Acidobacteria bacterium]|jgi:pilus assembly protein Flp/PilA|nr:Flp family type IVb pilin [Acidobacteriota bacterium]
MNNIFSTLKNLLRDESGQDLIEYALVAALIALAAVAAMSTLGKDISSLFTSVSSQLTAAII